MSIRVMTLAWGADLPASEKLVLLALADNANDEGHCWPSATTIAKKCGQGERTVRRAIQALIAKGHVKQRQRSGTSAVYTVHPCQSGTPANAAPLPDCPPTPANLAPKPSGTVKPKKDKPSLDKRPREKFPAPPGVGERVWSDFLLSPKRRKAGMSETAYDGICRNLDNLAEHGFPPGEMVALAVERGWTTVKLDWVLEQANGRSGTTNGLGRHQPGAEARIVAAGRGFVARAG